MACLRHAAKRLTIDKYQSRREFCIELVHYVLQDRDGDFGRSVFGNGDAPLAPIAVVLHCAVACACRRQFLPEPRRNRHYGGSGRSFHRTYRLDIIFCTEGLRRGISTLQKHQDLLFVDRSYRRDNSPGIDSEFPQRSVDSAEPSSSLPRPFTRLARATIRLDSFT